MSRFLAIDADAHGLFVAAATLRGKGAITVEQTVALADDVPALAPGNAAALGAKLKELLKAAKVKPAPVLFVVGRDRVILKDVHHPPTPPAEEPAVVRFQALRELTEGPDEVLMDYTPVGEQPEVGERRALAVFVRKPVYLAAKQACEAAGLKLAAVTPRPFAVVAALRHAFATGAAPAPDDPAAPVAVVTLWGRGGEFSVARGKDVTFTRTIPAHALSGEHALTAELKRNLAVYAGQNPIAAVEAVYLAEADDPGGGWAGRVSAALPVPVYTFDPVAGSPTADLVPAPLRGRFAGPIGLLAARSASAALPINFAAPRQPRSESGPGRRRAVLGVLAVVAFLALGGVLAFFETSSVNARYRDKLAQRDGLDAELKLKERDGKRLAAAREFDRRSVNILDEKYDMSDRLEVAKGTITEFELTALPPPKKESRAAAAVPAVVPKNAPPTPVANIRVTLRTNDPLLAQKVADAFKNDRYYLGVTKTTTGQVDTATKSQQFVIAAQVVSRRPGEYARVLDVAPPPKPPAPDEFEGFVGGIGP